ncbi:hypothetical protein D1007_12247 [Hordeum vulgare]|nr:hypothetical protein D1007_12247 [Hordeum vulgare]
MQDTCCTSGVVLRDSSWATSTAVSTIPMLSVVMEWEFDVPTLYRMMDRRLRAGGSAKAGPPEIDDVQLLMKELGLREEDMDDVVFDETEASMEVARWIALARVNSARTYSQYWFFRNTRSAWDLAHKVLFKTLEDNLYTVQFSCLGYWERVTQEGP